MLIFVSMQSRVKEWIWRYGPAEIVSLITTLVPAIIIQRTTGDRIAAALGATWGGNLGYFGTILLRDVHQTRRALSASGRKYGWRSLGLNLRALVIEFGVAEVLDTLLVRPALMYYLPVLTGHFSKGIVAAKLLADVTFYLPAIIFYEWSKKRYRKF